MMGLVTSHTAVETLEVELAAAQVHIKHLEKALSTASSAANGREQPTHDDVVDDNDALNPAVLQHGHFSNSIADHANVNTKIGDKTMGKHELIKDDRSANTDDDSTTAVTNGLLSKRSCSVCPNYDTNLLERHAVSEDSALERALGPDRIIVDASRYSIPDSVPRKNLNISQPWNTDPRVARKAIFWAGTSHEAAICQESAARMEDLRRQAGTSSEHVAQAAKAQAEVFRQRVQALRDFNAVSSLATRKATSKTTNQNQKRKRHDMFEQSETTNGNKKQKLAKAVKKPCGSE